MGGDPPIVASYRSDPPIVAMYRSGPPVAAMYRSGPPTPPRTAPVYHRCWYSAGCLAVTDPRLPDATLSRGAPAPASLRATNLVGKPDSSRTEYQPDW